MDVIEFINNNGKKKVPNPNYNAKSKKRGEPRTIEIPDLGYDEDPRVNLAIQDFTNQTSISAKEAEKYNKAGLNWNNWENLDKQLSDSQSATAKWFNGLSQAVISEVGLGTLKGFTDLFDFVTSKILHITEDDYQNAASTKIQEWQDAFNNNIAPVYKDENINIQNGGLTDAGWWASNLPNIASTLTLLFPAKGISSVGKWVGKASNIGKGISKARRWATGVNEIQDYNKLNKLQIALNNPINIAKANTAAENIAEGLLMRTMENYQEARDTHIQTYQEASDKLNSMSDEDYKTWAEKNKNIFDKDIDINNRDKVAKAIAKKAADRTFSMDFSNTIFDIMQLHGLKNIGKGVKDISGRIVNEAQRTSLTAAKAFAKGGTESAKKAIEEAAKKPLYKRFGQGILDYGKYNAKTVLEEATEGIEEAVNYIAQQEGLTYGKAILEGNAKDYRATTGIDSYLTLGIPNIISTWTNRQGELFEYMKTPELQESAFWGVLGGVVFHNVGSAFNKGKLAFYRKAQEKARATNSTTGESISDANGWFNLLELPEDKAARVAIEKRISRLEQLSSDLKNIENGIDIFAQKNEDGTLPQFNGDVETKKALARRRVEADFKANITMDAMNSGTYKQLIDYFKSDEVKQAMVSSGLAKQENIDSYTEETVKDLEEVKNLYARQSTHVLNQIAALNASKKYDQTIPLEYAQIIAKRNVDRLLNIKQLNRQIADVESLAAEQEAITRETNPDVLFDEAKNTTELASLIDMYGRLTYEGKEIDKAIEEQGANYKLDRQKEKNNKQKEFIINRIKQTTLAGNDAGLSAIFAAVKYGRSYRKADDGSYYQDKDAFAETDEQILKEAKSIYNDDSNLSDDTVIQSAKSMLSNVDNILGKKGLANVNSTLLSHYVTIGQLKLQQDVERSQISSTQTQIQDDIDWEHNNLNEARAKMIDLATSTVIKALQQYDGILTDNYDNLINTIYKMYSQDKQEARRIAEQFMTNDSSKGTVTASEFLDALDVFNFSNRTNQSLYEYVTNIIDTYKMNRNQQRAEDTLEDETSSTENQEQLTDTENQNLNNPLQLNEESNTDQTNRQNQPITPSSDQQQNQQQNQQQSKTKGKKSNVTFNINSRGTIVSIKHTGKTDASTAKVIDNGDGTFTLDVNSKPKNQQLRYVIGGLFDGNVDLIDSEADWVISKNPIVKRKGNEYIIVKKGELRNVKYNNKDEEEYQTFKDLVNGDEKFKNDLLTNPDSVRDAVLEVLDTDNEDKANSFIERYLDENKVDSSSPVEENDDFLNNSQTDTQDIQDTQADTQGTSNNQTPQNSSTGEQESNSGVSSTNTPTTPNKPGSTNTTSTTSTTTPTNNSTNKTNEDLDNIRRGIAQTFGKYIPDMRATDINFDEISDKVEKELLDIKDKVGLSEEEIKAEVTRQKQMLKDAHDKLMSLQSKLAQNGANLAFASKLEEVDTTNFSLMFTNAVEAFMSEYKKIVVTPTVDGRQVVRLEDILRICNNVYPTSDISVAKSMYNVIYNYLKSPIGQAKYLTIDLNKGNKVLDNITKTTEQLQKEVDEQYDPFRVNINDFIEQALISNDSIKDEYFKALNSLNTGDELDMLATDKELLFRYGNVTIGNMPKPKINGDTFTQINEGWITDVKLDDKGDAVSSLKPIFEDIFLTDTSAHKALRELLIKNVILDRGSENYKTEFDSLVKSFSNNFVIKQLVEQARKDKVKGEHKIFINDASGIIDYDRLLNHLTKLWNYTQAGNNANSKTEAEDNIRASLNRWFNNLYKTYNTTYNITKDSKVKITKLNEGQINRAVEKDDLNTIENYDKLPLVRDAVAKKFKCKLGIVDIKGIYIDVAGDNTFNVKKWTANSTLIAVFSKNELPDYVKAIGVKLSEAKNLGNNSIVGSIARASMTHLQETFQEFIDKKGFGDINKIEDVIRSIIAIVGDEDRIPLFRAISGKFLIEDINSPNSNARGISIIYKGNNREFRRFRIYTNNKYNNSNFGYQDTKTNETNYLGTKNKDKIAFDAALAFSRFIADTCNINISRKGIINDNTKADTTKGFIIRKNGKFSIDITNKTKNSFNQEFDSYNDYITKGNLIRVNTKIGENGSNFTRKGSKQTANQILYVSLPTVNDNNKKVSTTNKDIQPTSDADTFNKVRQITETNKTSVGLEIFQTILGDEAYNQFKEISEGFNILNDILPKRIMFDAKMIDKQTGNKRSPIIVTKVNRISDVYDKKQKKIVRKNVLYDDYHKKVNGERVTANIPASEVMVIGNYFLNQASSNELSKRKEIIRKLIHEQLHVNFENKGIVSFKTMTEVAEIYEEFNKHLKEDLNNCDKNSNKYKVLKSIDFSTTGYKDDRLIEEFIVESLTNQTLFKYLNSIQVEDGKDNKKEDTLFTKIAKVIAKFFGWNIEDNSLYMKELNVLRDLTSRKEGEPLDKNDNIKEITNNNNNDVSDETNTNNIQPTNNVNNETSENNKTPEDNKDLEGDKVDTSNGFDISSIDNDLDLDDDTDDNDDYDNDHINKGYAAAIEEVNVDSEGFKPIINLEVFQSRLPNHLQAKFKHLASQGWFEIKCK